MKKAWVGLAGAIAASSVMMNAVYADTTSVSGTSVESVAPNLLKNLTFIYWSNYNGPSLGNVNSLQNNADGSSPSGDIGNAQNLDTFLIAGYKLSENVNVGPVVEFHYRPVVGQDLTFDDASIRIVNSHFLKVGTFNLSSDFRVLLPTAGYDRDKNMLGGAMTIQNMTYDVPGTKLTLGLYTFLKGRAYGDFAGKQELTRVYAAPNLSYALGKKVQFTIWNDLISLRHYRGTSGFNNDPIDIEPGVNWDVTSYLSLNPYVNIYAAAPTMNASYVGVIMTGKLL